MAATLSKLVEIRSQLAEQIESYCTKLIDKLDRTPWFRHGNNVRASVVVVPVRVLRESTRPEPARFERERGELDSAAKDRREREPSRDYIDPELAGFYEEAQYEERHEEVPWLTERFQVRRAIVLGGPGSGKSFLTQSTGIEMARTVLEVVRRQTAPLGSLVLPIHCTLARFADPALPANPSKALLDLVHHNFSPAPAFMTWLEPRLRTNGTWLLLDALDEVREDHRPVLMERLRALDGQGWQARVLLTCRPANWSRELIPWAELTQYELAPLNPNEIRQFIGHWYSMRDGASSSALRESVRPVGGGATRPPARNASSGNGLGEQLIHALDRNYPLAHAARTPLITTFLCLAHEEAAVTATTRRAQLYAHVVRGLVRRAWKEKPLAKTDPHVDDLVRFLVRIGRPLFQRNPAGNLFTHAEITAELEGSKSLPIPLSALEARRVGQPMPPPETWPTLLRDELLEAGVLVGAGLRDGVETQFSFAHRSLLEYLVARNLSEEVEAPSEGWRSVEAFVDKKSWHPAWQETVVFLAGLMADPVPLLALLADASKDDATRQRLCLAGRCLPELSETGRQNYQRALKRRRSA